VTITSFFLLFSEGFKKIIAILVSSVVVPHMLFKTYIFKVKTDRHKLLQEEVKITDNSIAICAHFDIIYIWAYNVVICDFWISNNENWHLVLKNSAKRGLLALVYNSSTILGPKKRNVVPPWIRPSVFFCSLNSISDLVDLTFLYNDTKGDKNENSEEQQIER
jgi:hypothetical protein